MYRQAVFSFLISTLSLLAGMESNAIADNGTVVTGTVIGIDPVNQIMRVYVTGVNGQAIFGNPQTHYVDYLVTPDTLVMGPNNQFVSQANVLVGSRIQMQFAGPIATTIVLLDHYNTIYNGGFVTYSSARRNYGSTCVQNHYPIHHYAQTHHHNTTQPIINRPAPQPVYPSLPRPFQVQTTPNTRPHPQHSVGNHTMPRTMPQMGAQPSPAGGMRRR
jgi:hypothetical protein